MNQEPLEMQMQFFLQTHCKLIACFLKKSLGSTYFYAYDLIMFEENEDLRENNQIKIHAYLKIWV